MSFFLLLIVSLGLSVVRESLGRTMIKCQVLAAAHFIFGGQLTVTPSSVKVDIASSHLCHWYRRA